MSVTAIVPVWNGRELLERLFASLDSQTVPAAEILAVDNGSTDGAPELALRRGARVLSMGRNAGFAAAVNRGIRESRTEWIAVLNTDVELAPDYIAALLAAANARNAWFATGKIVSASSPGMIDGTFDAVCRGGTAWRVGAGKPDGPAFSSERPIWSAPWTAAVFRAELFRRVGLLEESFESYLEDVDFGLRCAHSGFAGLYVPAALARHRGSASLGRWHPETVRRMARNQIWLVKRHFPAALRRRWWWRIFAAQALWCALGVRHGAALAAFRGAWRGLTGPVPALDAPKETPESSRSLESHLRESEQLIHQFQTLAGFDFYWRMYFLLTGGEAN